MVNLHMTKPEFHPFTLSIPLCLRWYWWFISWRTLRRLLQDVESHCYCRRRRGCVYSIIFFTSSIIWLSVLLFVSFSEWPDRLLMEQLINLRRLVSLLTLPSLAVATCPSVCGCACIFHFSVYVCYVLGSVPPSASASTICLYFCLVCRLLCLCLLYLWLCQKCWKKS